MSSELLLALVFCTLLIPIASFAQTNDPDSNASPSVTNIFESIMQWFKNLFSIKSTVTEKTSNHEQANQPQKEQTNPSTSNQQVSVDSSAETPCVLDTSKPSLIGGNPTNPPCVIENGSNKLYCFKDSSGIMCTVIKPQQAQQITPQNTQTQQEQSPYGPKQTQYWMDQFRQQPRFMDCSDQQLIHYMNIEKQFGSLSYVHSPLGNWTNNPDAQRYVGDTWMNPNPLSSQEEHWILDKQNEYASLLAQVENYHC